MRIALGRAYPSQSYARRLKPLLRGYATLSPHTPPPQTPYEVFDEPSKARQRDRALIRLKQYTKAQTEDRVVKTQDGTSELTGLRIVDYLREELAERVAERIEVIYCIG